MASPHIVHDTYDLVFAGGGASACVTASRLAKAFPNLSILVLECGPTTKDNPAHIVPGRFFGHLLPGNKATQFTVARPSAALGGRAVVVPSGRCIGGGSSINFMMYNRPAASDFDDWEEQFGNDGWAARELIPLLQKAECYEVAPGKETHGYDGPLKVSYGGNPFAVGKEILDVGPKLDKGHRTVGDEGNDFSSASVNVFYPMPKWISSDGRRSDVAHHYVYNSGLENLTFLDGCLVSRVIIENNIATGVEYLFDQRVYEDAPQDRHIVHARKLVVVAAGAMGSPLILERSGIGAKAVLGKADIPIQVELPGVGENYQDHVFYRMPYIADPNTHTMDPLFRGDPVAWCVGLEQWEKDGSGILATNGIDAVMKLRPTPAEVVELGPDFIDFWNKELADKPDKPLCCIGVYPGMLIPVDPSLLPHPKYITVTSFLNYPASTGFLHITSSDPHAAPDFDPGFLSDPAGADIAALRWIYKKGREYARRLPAFRGAFERFHPRFAADSPAATAMVSETSPVEIDAAPIVYSLEDDKAIDENIKQNVETTWHSMGTCAMKPREQGGVVDSRLNVYSVQRLKVADLSIAPSNLCANTYAVAIAIGEKAAVIISEELRGCI
ncbi:GMC oxidoreductase-domain-containing protein [Mycena amicta]|nr:GMC oxidoreductase-domain-containing protein [Mycena amicta]